MQLNGFLIQEQDLQPPSFLLPQWQPIETPGLPSELLPSLREPPLKFPALAKEEVPW
jgi:hypothetical protein